MKQNKRVVLAYSGGLDTSVIAHWLAHKKGYEVICVAVDVGQEENLDLREKALASGAVDFVVRDAKHAFVEEGLFQCLKAEAKYEGRYLLGTAIARPFIMREIIEAARQMNASAVAHGATGKGNDQARFQFTVYALAPDLAIIAPWRTKEFRRLIPGRKEAIAYARTHNIPIEASLEKPWSTDANLGHRSHEAGVLEDPGAEYPSKMLRMTKVPWYLCDDPEYADIAFEHGRPVMVRTKVGGTCSDSIALVRSLNTIAGRHGIGIIDMVESRYLGMKSRGVYEAPAMTVLYAAHRDLEGLCMDRDLMLLRDTLSPRYAALVYNGMWFGREMQALNALVNESQRDVSGEVRLMLYRGGIYVRRRTSPASLYRSDIATMESGGPFVPEDAEGFLRIAGLPLRIQKGGR